MPNVNSKPGPDDLIRSRIHGAGLRATVARISVMQELLAATSPLSHAQVAQKLASNGHDRATIYRNLVELSDAGIVSRIELGDHVWRFEIRRTEDAASADHPHFVCVDCGEVSCLPNGSVSIQQQTGSKPALIGQVTEVLLKGHCIQCG